MKRVVIDTNVLVSAAYDDHSASYRIIEACLRGDLTALLSPELRQEYERIVERAVRLRGYEDRVRQFLAAAEPVTTREIPRVVPGGPGRRQSDRHRHRRDDGGHSDKRSAPP